MAEQGKGEMFHSYKYVKWMSPQNFKRRETEDVKSEALMEEKSGLYPIMKILDNKNFKMHLVNDPMAATL